MADERSSEDSDVLPALRAGSRNGIEVEEAIDIEDIELQSKPATTVENLGWDTAHPAQDLETLLTEATEEVSAEETAGSKQEARDRLEGMNDEPLRLAAELAELRRTARERERALLEQLAKTRAVLRERDEELTNQVAQIASLTLEAEGLRSQLSDHGGAASAPFGAGTDEPTGSESMVMRLKQRLAERGNALVAAREDLARLARERARLAEELAARGAEVEKLLARMQGRRNLRDEVLAGLDRLLHRPAAANDEAGESPAAATGGSEQPAVRQEPAAAVASGQDARPPDGATDRTTVRLRHAESGTARPKARRRRPHAGAGLRRYLIALDPAREEVCELGQKRMYVGRGGEADVQVADATVSRLHAVLYLERGATVVEDACSTNGVFVNLQRVRRAVLMDGDTVAFGTVRFQYRVGPAATSLG